MQDDGKARGIGRADLVVLGLLGMVLGLALALGRGWRGAFDTSQQIDLAPTALFGYSAFSLARGFSAWLLSLAVTFWLGLWAAKDRRAERVIIPLVHVLQSVPILGFMPGLVLGLVALFPGSRIGLEIAAVTLIFTSQAWNMILAFYQSIKSEPPALKDACDVAGFSRSRRFFVLELPHALQPLVWNSMMSMAGGWFFLTVSEAFTVGSHDFRLPGVGAYMAVAIERGDAGAMAWGLGAMAAMVLLLDQLVWRPLLAWAWRFRYEESAERPPESWAYALLSRSALMHKAADLAGELFFLGLTYKRRAEHMVTAARPGRVGLRLLGGLLLLSLAAGLFIGLAQLFHFLAQVGPGEWLRLAGLGALTLLRVAAACLLGSLLGVPLGLFIGLNPSWRRVLQPVVQLLSSFPAPMLFPFIFALMLHFGVGLQLGSVVLMTTGTAWYIVYNSISGAARVQRDWAEAYAAFGSGSLLSRWRFLLPATLPSLLVGWETAVGGAWNASIITEVFVLGGVQHQASGLGAAISQAAAAADFPTLAAAVTVMCVFVVTIDRFVWHPLEQRAQANLQ